MSGASRALLTRALLPSDQQIWPVVSQPLLLEYEDVLKHPENVVVHGFSESEIARLIDAFIYSAGRIAAIYFRTRPTLRDPNDELVLEAAVNGRADWLITFNLRHLQAEAAHYGIECLRPSEAIQRLMKGDI